MLTIPRKALNEQQAPMHPTRDTTMLKTPNATNTLAATVSVATRSDVEPTATPAELAWDVADFNIGSSIPRTVDEPKMRNRPPPRNTTPSIYGK